MLFKNRLGLFILITIINFIILVGIEGNKNFLNTVVYGSTNFIKTAIGDVAVLTQKTKSIFVSNTNLRDENKRLKKEITEYRKQIKSIDALLFENQKIRTLLQFSYSIDYDVLPANIVSVAIGEGRHGFIINKGVRAGVSNGMIVCGIYQNRLVLLGKIIAVSTRTATFQSINEVSFSMPVITNVSNQRGFLVGQGAFNNNLQLIFDSLYLSKNVFVGEEVFIYEYSNSFPRGIPIGTISNIVSNKDDLLISANVTPFISPDMVDVVVVLIGKEQRE